jgi:hypothetical protein
MKTFRYVQPMTYASLNVLFVIEIPDTLQMVCVQMPASTTVQGGGVNQQFQKSVETKFGPVTLKDMGNWDNLASSAGAIKHPFAPMKVPIDSLKIVGWPTP